MRQTRVLIVDDSRTMQRLVEQALDDNDIEVVGFASDAHEAREAIKRLNPDVITLDVEMPGLDGLAFLERLMRLRPTPVVMVSNLTARGADTSLRALELGAVECVCKPGPGSDEGFNELAAIVKSARRARLRRPYDDSRTRPVNSGFRSDGRILAIGASTGGVEALLTLVSQFPANCPPTMIAQHMPALFTKSFAERLNRHCAAQVREAFQGAPLAPGNVYLAPGGRAHLTLRRGNNGFFCHLDESEAVNGHRPSVDALFRSVAKTARASATGVILTGMGRDGAEGLLEMRRAGAATFGQDAQSSVIYGMPRVAWEIGAVQQQGSPEALAGLVLSQMQSAAIGA
ncbi:MAG: chemotaxis response regulator protein-glutamate methylesterase [Hyphomicrobiales bacterium]|nr:chemotaxis response regulator protein-glutamate methylesterase [Hyphomicrobiales bacterium]